MNISSTCSDCFSSNNGRRSPSEPGARTTPQFTFTVTLSAAYDEAVTMSFQTVNGTATTSDSDYIAACTD